MRLDRGFHLSFYLTMLLACASISYAEQAVVPEVESFAWPVAGLFVLAYVLEGRWSLSKTGANLLVVVIVALIGLLAGRFLERQAAASLEGQALLLQVLTHLGLVLVIGILALLFRPKRRFDYWLLHLAAFMIVALACSLEADLLLGFLISGYLLAVTWNLSLLYLLREEPTSRQAHAQAALIPWRFLGLAGAVPRVVVASLCGLALFMSTPRVVPMVGEEGLIPARLQTGVGALMDLNRTGRIRMSGEVVFEVDAEHAGGEPKLDLDGEQRWRAMVLDQYEEGKWYHQLPKQLPTPADVDATLPNLGPQQYFLNYRFNGRLGRIAILAEPIPGPAPGQPASVVFFTQGTVMVGSVPRLSEVVLRAAVRYPDGELHPPSGLRGFYSHSYRQVVAPAAVPGLGPPIAIGSAEIELLRRLPALPGLEQWTGMLLDRLVERGKLPPEAARRSLTGGLLPEHREEVALAFERYLAHSGEYGYSLRLHRHDRSADPIVDFLFNIKEGHCERFASALVVMLRAQGIPARVVLGYRGLDNLGGGRYFVRNSHAHSWVEALVERPGAAGPEFRWLTLDPTPGSAVSGESLSPLGRWWHNLRVAGGTFWQNYILDFGSEQQDSLVRKLFDPRPWRAGIEHLLGSAGQGAAAQPGTRLTWLGACAALLTGWLLLRRCQKRKRAQPLTAQFAFYERWLKVLRRHCRLAPLPAQTPREFARAVSARLENDPATRSLSRLPEIVALLYYRVRYAKLPLSDPEQAELATQIAALQTAASRAGRP